MKSPKRDPIIIQPNSKVTTEGYTDKMLPYNQTMALIQRTEKSLIPSDLDIIPHQLEYKQQQREPVLETVSYVMTRTVKVPPRAIIAEIQPGTFEYMPELPADDTSQELNFNIAQENLTEEQFVKADYVIVSNRDIFSMSEADIGQVTAIKHRIKMTDHTHFKQRHRRIPPSIFKEVIDHLQYGDLQMCVDYRQLNNKTTKKDAYAIPRIEEILDS